MKIRAFRGIRPLPELAARVASEPYDVISSAEAREKVKHNPLSFLRIVKPEVSLPEDADVYSPEVYEAGKQNFRALMQEGVFLPDPDPCLYLYELIMDGRSQCGIVACAAVDDYLQGRIKKHELTRPDKELDRKNHVRVSMMNAEPVFFAYRAIAALDGIMNTVRQAQPDYDFTAEDGVEHRFWVISDVETVKRIIVEFENMPATYVADGHHRTAAAALVGEELRQQQASHTGSEEYNYFLAVHFPHDQLQIIDYNRVVTDLNGLDPDAFLEKISASFDISQLDTGTKPASSHQINMYLAGAWYALSARPGTYDDNDPIAALDVTILSRWILEPVLAIEDLRTDRRIDFVGGTRGIAELERRVDSGEMSVAFAMYPVSMQQLMDIADNDLIMPPKVTWFEPKLRSGLVVHSLADSLE